MPATVRIEKNIFAEKGALEGGEECILRAGIVVTNEATRLCPKDYGQLANSIMTTTNKGDFGFNSGESGRRGSEPAPAADRLTVEPKKLEGYVGTNSDHWFPEFGTRYMAAQPFLRPAADVVIKGSTAQQIAEKYGPEAMRKEFLKRQVQFKEFKG